MNKTWNKMMKEYMATPKAYWMLGLASKHGSLEVLFGKHQWMVLFYWRKQGFKGQKKRTMEPVIFSRKTKNIKKKSQTISNNLKKSQKKTRKISKYLKISLMLFLKRGFARLGSLLHIFLDHRKSQKISKNLKIFQICRTKNKKTRKKQNKTKQTNANLQKPWTISAILALFPQAVKCYFLHCILLQPDSV